MGSLVVVMYHYVRPLKGSRFPAIKGLSVEAFEAQLEEISRRYRYVSVGEVVHCSRTGDALPEDAILLTFDDGYRDHFEYVFPLLQERGIPGAFFPPVDPVRNGVLLDVNRIHFILAACPDPRVLGGEIDDYVEDSKTLFGLMEPREYRAKWAKPNRFDDAETIYVKRMLQVGLPAEVRSSLAAELFRKRVTTDEAAFARDLYMSVENVREMQREGMYVGSHGRSHRWLDSLSREEQAEEIDASVDFLREIGSPVDDYWAICYPFGAWNESLLEELKDRECALGFTTEPRVAELGAEQPLLIPRLDTNDLFIGKAGVTANA